MNFPVIKPVKILRKQARTICLVLGGIYSFFSLFALLILKLQMMMLSEFDSKEFNEFAELQAIVFDIWNTYMPLLFFIGLSYLTFGLLFNKLLGKGKFLTNLILGLISFTWAIAYSISCLPFLRNTLPEDEIEFFEQLNIGASIFAFTIAIAMFTIPQIIIGIKIKRLSSTAI